MAVNNLTEHRRPPIIGIWVDLDVENQLEMQEYLRKLSRLIEEWHFFNDKKVFYDFLDDNPKKEIFLIMSGSIGQIIVPAKHHFANIHSIYIYCQIVAYHQNLKTIQYDKVKDVMNLSTDLYKRIIDELTLLLIEIGNSYIDLGDRALAKVNLEEALNLMKNTLRWDNKHGRICRAQDLLNRLETWKEHALYSI